MRLKIKQIIWDWNGTLLDDINICVETINTLLSRYGLRKLENKVEYREVFGFPIEEYYLKLGFDFDRVSYKSLADEYIELYNRNLPRARLFKNTEITLKAFKEAGISQTALSATRSDRLQEQLILLGVSHYFDQVLGTGDHLAAGKLDIAHEFMKLSEIAPEKSVFIGDTVHDFEVAREVGANCVLISGGHHSEERLKSTGATVVADISELPGLLLS